MDLAVRVARLPMDAVLRTHTRGQTFGFMKVLVSGSDESIVGFTMVGSEAAEVMAAVQTTMLAKVPYATLRDAGIARLTMTEELEPLANVPPR